MAPVGTTIAELERWLQAEPEAEHLEFKEAKQDFDSRQLSRYCVALANEGGGTLVLGVTNALPRRVVGTQAFLSVDKTRNQIYDRLGVRVEMDELQHPDGRVAVVRVPSRPLGMPLHHEGAYLMRVGGSLRPMTQEVLERIFAETGPDYTAEACDGATIESLSPEAIGRFRAAWVRKSEQQRLESLPPEQLLADADLLAGGKPTYAALILLGTPEALSRFLADAEVIHEYRSSETSVPYQYRAEYREGFLLFHDALWDAVAARNTVHQFQDGFLRHDIPVLSEEPVREAVLNAVTHRDYRRHGSVFVRQYPDRLLVESPGGFPKGVTEENILWKQAWRNRRLAEALAKCGFVERSGQGVNMMFEQCLQDGKPRPSFSGTDAYQVSLTLRGTVDTSFVLFLEDVARQSQQSLSLEDLLVLDYVRQDEQPPRELHGRLRGLVEAGALEQQGRGRGVRYLLPRRYYRTIGKPGLYTRKAGLDRETHTQLLLKHIRDNDREGSPFGDLAQVVPELSRAQVKGLLRELKGRGDVRCLGHTKAGRWHAGPGESRP